MATLNINGRTYDVQVEDGTPRCGSFVNRPA